MSHTTQWGKKKLSAKEQEAIHLAMPQVVIIKNGA
jgi:hypothetical protein